jgi:BlaI family transcriptional regulator, penicillinase repressor
MRDPHPLNALGRRERQIMDILFRLGRATAAEVQEALPDAVSNSGVRGMLRLLQAKGHVTVAQEGPRYIYSPAAQPEEVSRSAVRHLVSTFFQSSTSSAIAALLENSEEPLSDAEYERLVRLLDQAREGGEGK